MTWQTALETVVARTRVERYRHLCSDANALAPPNDRGAYRRLVVDLAGGELTPTPDEMRRVDAALAEHGTAPAPCGCCQ